MNEPVFRHVQEVQIARPRVAVWEALVGETRHSLSDAELLEPIEGEAAQFAANRAVLMSSLAFHEGVHMGQVSVARRAAGLPPMF